MVQATEIHEILERIEGAWRSDAGGRERFVEALVSGHDAERPDWTASADLRAGALLRLLSLDQQIVYKSDHRREALNLIQERLKQRSPSVLAKYGQDSKRQADEACRMLAPVAADADKDLAAALAVYKGTESLQRLRQQLLRSLKSDLAKVTVQPFLPLGADPSEPLLVCLTAAIEYVQAGPGDAARMLEDARSAAEEVLAARGGLTNKVFQPIVDVVARVLDDLSSNYRDSPYSKPADLTLDASVRRHPLHTDGLELAIPVVLSNVAAGVALDVEIEMTDAVGLVPSGVPTRLQRVEPGQMVVELRATTISAAVSGGGPALATIRVSWGNADGTEGSSECLTEIHGQDWTVDWGSLQLNNPYSLEAVTTEDELIGRGAILGRIAGTLTTQNIGSLYIHGQKRVGKTSLARVALRQMEVWSSETKCIYEDIGGYPAEPGGAVDTLTRNLLQALDDVVGIPEALRPSSFDGSLSPLITTLKSLARRGSRIVIALDEFDRLPVTLFRRNEHGDSFFTGLRAISNIDGVGLILIGGERMRLIINAGGVELNKFAAFPIDYLDRSTQWAEFEELVRNPTHGRLEFTDDACALIYEYTAGNPYYTKLLCGQILESAALRRDAYVDEREVESAVEMLLGRIDPTAFAHYWEDFMLEQDEKRDEITLNRRRCLLAIGLAQEPSQPVAVDDVISEAAKVYLDAATTHQEIDSLVSRGLFLKSGATIQARVRLFERWLIERGQQQIVLAGAELEAASHAVERRERFRVSYDEVEQLVSSWGAYQGRALTPDRVLTYLHQFGEPESQRLVFKVLTAVRFVDDATVSKLFRSAYGNVQASLKDADGAWKQNQIRISHFGGVGKSSLAMARAFASANKLRRDSGSIVSPNDLAGALQNGLKDVIFVDDFIGTGGSICGELASLAALIPDAVRIHVVALAGMSDGVDVVDGALREVFGERVTFHVPLELPSRPDVFDPQSGVFASIEEATDAKALLTRVGEALVPNAPLGYGANCSLIVFSTTIPNNAPAVLWKGGTAKMAFTPLFPRP